MAKLHSRVEKQTHKKEELKALVTTLTGEVEQLDYERGQYKEKTEEVSREGEELE